MKEEQKKNLERAQICNWKWLASNKSFKIYVSKNIYGKILFNGLYYVKSFAPFMMVKAVGGLMGRWVCGSVTWLFGRSVRRFVGGLIWFVVYRLSFIVCRLSFGRRVVDSLIGRLTTFFVVVECQIYERINPLMPKGFCIFEAIFWIHTPHGLS